MLSCYNSSPWQQGGSPCWNIVNPAQAVPKHSFTNTDLKKKNIPSALSCFKNYICLSKTILFANKFISVINQITLKKNIDA